MPNNINNTIRSKDYHQCYVCNSEGAMLHAGLEDHLFHAPGKWNLRKCTNDQCGLVWLDPMPLSDDLWMAYRDYYTHGNQPQTPASSIKGRLKRRILTTYLADRYGYATDGASAGDGILKQVIKLFPGHSANLDLDAYHIPYQPNGRLLEVGCGGGAMLKGMADLGWIVEGVDFDENAVRNAREKGLHIRHGNLTEQQYEDNSWDVIAMIHVIEHVPNPRELLLECKRILKPGGKLVIVTPNVNSMGHRIFQSSWRGLEPPRHLHIFTTGSLSRLGTDTGFRNYSCKTVIRDANNLFQASFAIRGREQRRTRNRLRVASEKILAKALQGVEWANLQFDPQAGEEIVLVLEK